MSYLCVMSELEHLSLKQLKAIQSTIEEHIKETTFNSNNGVFQSVEEINEQQQIIREL